MDKKFRKRLITLLLSLALIITYMPTSFLAYAVDNDAAVTTETPSDGGGDSAGDITDDVTDGGQTVTDPAQEPAADADEPQSGEGNSSAATEEPVQTGGNSVTYSSNDGVEAVTIQGDAAKSESAAIDAIQEELGVSRKEAKRMANELFEGGDRGDEDEDESLAHRKKDGSFIEWLHAKWLTEDTEPFPSGYTDTANNLYIRPDSDDDQTVRLELSYSLSGEHDYPEGKIRITIPDHIFLERKDAQGNRKSYGIMVLPIGADPNKEKDFNWKQENGNYIFTNTKTLDAAHKGYFEIAITGLTPHELVDMEVYGDFQALIEVTTNKNNLIWHDSEKLTAQFDTYAKVNSVSKKKSGNVQVVGVSEVPTQARSDDPRYVNDKYYVCVWWQVWGATEANTLYNLTRTDTIGDTHVGKLRYHDAGDGRTSTVTTGTPIYEDGETDYYTYATYYPLSQFTAGQQYTFRNNITLTATEVDTGESSSQNTFATTTWKYTDPTWREPIGHFNVHKNGNDGSEAGNIMRHTEKWPGETFTDEHVNIRFSEPNGFYGIYPSGLNQIRDKGSAEISYTVNSIGYIFPWTYVEPDPPEGGEWEIPPTRVQENYNKKSVTMETTDNGVTLGRRGQAGSEELTLGSDYEYASVEFLKNVKIYKAEPQNINPDGSWSATSWGDGTFKYTEESDWTKYPDIELWIQNSDDTWEKWATASWKTQNFKITLHDGTETNNAVVTLPSGTKCFKTMVTAGDRTKNSEIGAISYDVRPVIRLLGSDHMKALINEAFEGTDTPEFFIYNNTFMKVLDNDGNYFKFKQEGSNTLTDKIVKDGYDSVRGYTTNTKVYPTKEGIQEFTDIDAERQVYTIHYKATVEEQSFISDNKSYLEAVRDGYLKTETSGVWYDLLPEGVEPVMSSIQLREGDSFYAYKIRNYKSNRTLLVVVCTKLKAEPVKIETENGEDEYYEDVPTITFDAEYSFDNVVDYGDRLHNVIAFESGNDFIGTIEDYTGEPDNPNGPNYNNVATERAFADDQKTRTVELNAMTNLDPDSDDPRFVYAGCTTMLKKVSAATTGLSKLVDVNGENHFTSGVYDSMEEKEEKERIVYEGGQYTYKIRMESSVGSQNKDIRIYDSLENFVAIDGNSDVDVNIEKERWQGTFLSVNVDQLVNMGCVPIIYYSDVENLSLSNEDDPNEGHEENMDLTDENIWIEASKYERLHTDPSGKVDLSGVKAFAVDASWADEPDAEGKHHKEFVLDEKQSVVIYVNMQAPSGPAAREYIAKSAHAYNNVHMLTTTVDKATGTTNSDSFVRKDYTKVGLGEFKINVTKEWDDEDNRDKVRPPEIQATLCTVDENGNHFPVDRADNPVTLNESNNWSYTFENIPYTDENGAINYTIDETISEEASKKYEGSMIVDGNSFILINKHIPERTRIDGKKEWKGDNEQFRPESIEVQLYANGEPVEGMVYVITPKSDGSWSYAFEDLYKYEDGEEITYSVKEKVNLSNESYEISYDENDIINKWHPYGDLYVRKLLVGASDKAAENTFEFKFKFRMTVTEEDGTTSTEAPLTNYEYEILDLDGNPVYDEDGEPITGTVADAQTITIHGDQQIHIKDIEQHVRYTVTETKNKAFVMTSSHGSGTIKPNVDNVATFTNTYSAEGKTNFKAIKELVGRKLQPNMFQFRIYRLEEDGSKTWVGTAVNKDTSDENTSVDADGNVTSTAEVVSGYLFYNETDAGKDYYYTFEEWNAGLGGFTYDRTVYYVKVEVRDETGTGELTCHVTYYDKDPTDPDAQDITSLVNDHENLPYFKNTYGAEGDEVLKALKVLKTQSRKLQEGEFTFELLDDDDNVIATVTNDADGIVTFQNLPELHFTQADDGKTFHFWAREVIPDDAVNADGVVYADANPEQKAAGGFYKGDVVYDNTTFDYYITVKDMGDGTLSFNTETKQGDEEGVSPTFVNPLRPGQLIVQKTVSGAGYDPTQEFHFLVTLTGQNIPKTIDYDEVPITTGTGNGGESNNDDDDAVEAEAEAEEDMADEEENVSQKSDSEFALSDVTDMFSPLAVYAEEDDGRIEPDTRYQFHVDDNDPMMDGTAYAIVTDEEDERGPGHLIIFRSYETYTVYNSDEDAYDRTVTDIKGNVYHGYLSGSTESGYAGWRNIKDENHNNIADTYITSFEVAEGQAIKPQYMGAWFTMDGLSSDNLDLSRIDTSQVKEFRDTFTGKSLTNLDLRTFDTSSATDMYRMFGYCYNLQSVDLSSFDTSRVKNMEYMFYACSVLPTVDLRTFDTSSVQNMRDMFAFAGNLSTIKGLKGFDTRNVTNMKEMFYNTKVAKLDLSSFNIAKVTNMTNMFRSCIKLETLIIGDGFYAPALTNAENMFLTCSKIETLDLSQFITPALQDASSMFKNCTALKYLIIPGLDNTTSYTGGALNLSTSTELIEITLGDKFSFDKDLLTDPSPATIDKWVRSDWVYGPYLPSELKENYSAAMAGKWVWATENKISYDGNDEDMGSMSPGRFDPTEAYTLPKNNFIKLGYKFTGWKVIEGLKANNSSAVGMTFDNKATIPAGTFRAGYDVVLEAQWEKIGDDVPVTDGTFEIIVHGGYQAVIDDLPEGTTYYIEELTPSGWVLVDSGNVSGIIPPAGAATAWFENEFNHLKTSARIVGLKLLDEEAAGVNTFNFELRDEAGNLLQTKPVAAGGAVIFDSIKYEGEESIGTYHYTVTEVVPGSEDDDFDETIDYDSHTEHVTVVVSKDDEGNLQAEVSYDNDGFVFKNTHKPGNLTLKKTAAAGSITDANKDTTFKFSITLKKADGTPYTSAVTYTVGSGLFPATETMTPDASGTLTIEGIKAGQSLTITGLPAGTTYTIVETDLPDGWAVTSQTNVSGKIVANATAEAEITNEYTAEIKAKLYAHKKLIGDNLTTGEFTFELRNTPDGEAIQTKTNGILDASEQIAVLDDEGNVTYEPNPWVGTGLVEFDPFTYDVTGVGEHVYYIVETAGTDLSTEYDGRVIKAVVTVTDNGDGTLSADVKYYEDGNEVDGALFINKRFGKIKLLKSVDVASPADPDAEFTFTITLKDANDAALTGTYDTMKTSGTTETAGTIEIGADGGTINLKADESIVISGLPVGTVYTITEADKDGWTATGMVNDSGTISTETAEVSFTNTYDASGELVLDADKTLTGRDLEPGEFHFAIFNDTTNALVCSVANGVYDEEGNLVSANAIEFPSIHYTLEDVDKTYKYRVVEYEENLGGVTYDNTIYKVEVTISDNGDGTLKVEKNIIDANAISFTNPYDANGYTVFEGTKKIVGRSFLEYDKWTFTVTPKNGGPMPRDAEGNEISPYTYVLDKDSGITPGTDTATFKTDKIYYTLADAGKTYRYEITESGSIAGVTNDTTTYTVHVTVKDNGDGTLSITKKYTRPKQLVPTTHDPLFTRGGVLGVDVLSSLEDYGFGGTLEERPGGGSIIPIDPGHHGDFDDEKLVDVTDDATFTNIYQAEGETPVLVWKGINNWGNATQFVFKIEPADEDAQNSMPVGEDGNIIDTATVTPENNPASFGTFHFDKTGTFYYIIYEVVPGDAVNADGTTYANATAEEKAAGGFVKDGIAYDSARHTVEIKVTDPNHNGVLDVAVKYDDEAANYATVNNTYSAVGKTDIPISKKLTGRDFQAHDSWTFQLSGELKDDTEGTAIVPLPAVTSVTITPDASDPDSLKATFGDINYTLANAGKTYVYTITESGNVAGVTNAEPIVIEVTVTDNGDGTLTVTRTPDADPTFEFDNVYEAKGTAQLKATKELDPWGDAQEFTFILKPVGNAPMPKDAEGNDLTEVARIATKAAPEAVFPEITYTAAGTYSYQITELIPGDAVNEAGTRYQDATDEEKAAGGFRLDGIEYDSKVHTATVVMSENDPKNGILNSAVTYDSTTGTDGTVSGDATLTIKNKYIPPELEITKKLDGFVDGGEMSNVTIGFRIDGYKNGVADPEFTTYAGMTFNKNDVGADGYYTKTIKIKNLPRLDRFEVTEVYSSNYNGQTPVVTYDSYKGLWTVTIDNTHNGYTPGSGVVNKYENGTYVKPGGNAGGGGEPSAGNEGGN